MDVTVNGNGKSNFFQNLLKPTKLQNYFFIHIPIQQLSTYYKIKVAVPLFSEILQNKWLDMTDPSCPAMCEWEKLICWCEAVWLSNPKKFAPSDSLTKEGVDTWQQQKSVTLIVRTDTFEKWLDVTKLWTENCEQVFKSPPKSSFSNQAAQLWYK